MNLVSVSVNTKRKSFLILSYWETFKNVLNNSVCDSTFSDVSQDGIGGEFKLPVFFYFLNYVVDTGMFIL